jgi:hypothetical protein
LLRRDFEQLLLEAVDEELTSLGESSKQALYFHLEKGFNVKKDEIPYKTEAFVDAIEKIFGLGANYLEILIMKRLYEKIGQGVKVDGCKDLTFTEYVTVAKRSFLVKEKPENKEEAIQCKHLQMEH